MDGKPGGVQPDPIVDGRGHGRRGGVIMLGFMWSMYPNARVKTGILIGNAVIFALAFLLVQSQEMVSDVSYMKAMIPHHSMAIMTSERAHIKDPDVRKHADGIIDAQVREITQMKRMIARLEATPAPANAPDLPSYRDLKKAPPELETDKSTRIETLKPVS
jgi:hypothetical protein